MLKRTYLFALIVLGVFIFSSCNKSNKIGRYIPADVSVAVHFNGKALNEKLPWGEVKSNELFQQIYSDTALNAVMKSALDNPENTGIDINDDLVFFVQQDSAGGYAALTGNVKDASKFKAFYSNATSASAVAGKDGANTLSNDKMTAMWNDKRFVIAFDAPPMSTADMNNFPMPGMDSIVDVPAPVVAKRDLTALVSTIFNVEEKSSLAKNEKFSDLLDQKGDVHFWLNTEVMMKSAPGLEQLSMFNFSKLYEGSLMVGTATFLDGKIEVDMKSYASKEMTDLFKKYEGANINAEMAKRMPVKDVAMYMALNFKPEGLKEFLKLAGLEGFANMGAGMLGFTLDDFIKANKGEIAFALSDMVTDSAGKSDASFIFTAAINDKASFSKLVDAGKKATQGKLPDSLGNNSKITFNMNDNYFAISNRPANVENFLKGGNSNPAFFDKISGNPFGMYINFQYMLRASAPAATDSIKAATHAATLRMFEDIIIKGGQFKDGGMVQHMEVNLVDKKINSLKQLNSYLGEMGAITKRRKAEMDNVIMADTTVALR